MKKLTLIFAALLITCYPIKASTEIDSIRLNSFMEGLIVSKLSANNIAGATACIVKDGEILLLDGYGYSDLDDRNSVDPAETMFRIGSISKMFTWLAVMQMVEQDKLDLDDDINQYIADFQIPETFEEPITMTHLMSHAPGFEDIVTGLFAEELIHKPLSELLQKQMPARVIPPGNYAAYSNHGTALAGHIVENLSGMEWNDYVEQNIIFPLDMQHTTFRQPLPDRFKDNISKGYKYENNEITEKPFEFVPLSPAGAATTTAKDMANFMRMLLQRGHYNDNVIISPDIYDIMLQPVMFHAPMVNPGLYGFVDMSMKGEKIIGHGGSTFWFHSLMALMPEHDLGFFISFNSEGGPFMDVLEAFIDKFFLDDQKLSSTIELEEEYLEHFCGSYKSSRTPHTDYTKLLSMLNRATISVKNGMLRTELIDDVKYWMPIDSLIFREKNSCEMLAFEKDEKGKISHAFLSSLPIMAFDKVPFYESQSLNLAIILIAVIFSLVALIFWPMVFFTRRNFKPLRKAPKTLPIGAKVTAWFTALFLLCFYILISVVIGDAENTVFNAPPPNGMIVVLLIPFIVMILTLIMIYNTFSILPLKDTRRRSRLYYAMLTIINVIALCQLYYWNFIGFHYH